MILPYYIQNSLPKYVIYALVPTMSFNIQNIITKRSDSYTYVLVQRNYLLNFLSFCFLDINVQSKFFVDLVGADFPSRQKRFFVLYNLLSSTYHIRILPFCFLDELDRLYSVTQLFPAAQWFEREVWDLFGIHFYGHGDLRRILTDYGFFGHPLRKDFPLSGFVELVYNARLNSIVYQDISLVQEFRSFDTLSPWDYFASNKVVAGMTQLTDNK